MTQPTFKSYFFSFFTLFVLNICFSQTTSSTPTTVLESTLDSNLGKDVNLDGDTSDTVYLISSLSELLWITENVRDNGSAWSEQKIFLQTEDIDASETKYWDDADDAGDNDGNNYNDPNDSNTNGNNEGWYPIGYGVEGFEGFYNGDYHRILNLHIKRNITDDIGFISKMNSPGGSAGVVRLGIIGGDFTVLSNSANMNIGGVMGKYYNPSIGTKLDQVFFEGRIDNQSISGFVGGLVGYFYAGSNQGTIKNSYANVDIFGGGTVIGGLYGRQSSGFSENVYARGSFDPNGDSSYYFGGLVGQSDPNTFDYKIENGYSAFEINNASSNAYLIVGDDSWGDKKGYFTNLYYDTDLSSAGWNDGILDSDYTPANVQSQTTAFLTSSATLASNSGLLSDTLWGQNDAINDGYPYLKGWMDFGLSSSTIDDQITQGDDIGDFIFLDGGVSTTVDSYVISSTLFDNQYFEISANNLKIQKAGVTQISNGTTSFTILVEMTTTETTPTKLKRTFVLNVVDVTAPQATLSHNHNDAIVKGGEIVRITATFDESLSTAATLSATTTNTVFTMTASASSEVWYYDWTAPSDQSLDGSVYFNVEGKDASDNRGTSTQSITLTLDNYFDFTLTDDDADNVFNLNDIQQLLL
ncbi:hypothetical protein OAI60_00965 [Flavobacteriaceae bacterium]|nr:hypothetical protein [Flavobacteriaceae bacterium]